MRFGAKDKGQFAEIDRFFLPWAKSHGLAVYTQARDEEIRSVLSVGVAGSEYQIWATPELPLSESKVSVGAALLRRANKKHTFYRERKNYQFRVSVPLEQSDSALSEALTIIQRWEEEFSRNGNS